jgi:hypothetical protein
MATAGPIADLQSSLRKAESLLRRYGDRFVSDRLHELDVRLEAGDMDAIQSALTESTGSMGSLQDRYLCPENGDAIERGDVRVVNAELVNLVGDVRIKATAATASLRR